MKNLTKFINESNHFPELFNWLRKNKIGGPSSGDYYESVDEIIQDYLYDHRLSEEDLDAIFSTIFAICWGDNSKKYLDIAKPYLDENLD